MRRKRIFDLAVACAALVICSPLLLAAAVAVKLNSRGPALDRPTRVGRKGKLFRPMRFRLVRVDNHQLTATGRFLRRSTLDGLPQLLNVIRGDMSLVGPPPEAPETVAEYTPSQRRILAALPGMTSPWGARRARQPDGSQADLDDARSRSIGLRDELDYFWHRSLIGDIKAISDALWSLALRNGLVAWLRMRVPWSVLDLLIALAAYDAAYYLRFLDSPNPYRTGSIQRFGGSVALFAAAYVVTNLATRLDRRVWRYATAAEVVAIARSCAITTGVIAAVDLAVTPPGGRLVPISVVLSGGFLTFAGFVAVRYRWRLVTGSWHRRRLASRRPAWAVKTLIFGAGEAGQLLAWRLLHLSEGSGFSVVGFVDDDPNKQGRLIHGIPVLGSRSDLPHLSRELSIELIAVAIANISGEEMRSLLTLAQQTEAKIKIVPDLFDWMSDNHEPLREIQVEDLLGRIPHPADTALAREAITGMRVLVTGAAGSIGSALCQQISKLGPASLVALDSNESGLFDLATDLRAQMPDLPLTVIVGDVTRASRTSEIIRDHQPDLIFHVAAYKHVPLMEEFPEEAVRVNALGTWTVLSAAREHCVERMVLVSTDKAVNPTSIMGATKRIAEMLVSSDQPTGNNGAAPTTTCTAVRFGNVLGSRGSVVPTFERQIGFGGPVTVTDPSMTRYFMAVEEAASLIIQAAQLTTGQDIFMLDMGDQIRIDDLARKMIRMRGLRPDVDIQIEYVGMRPGEKLQEELSSSSEEVMPTVNPLINRLTRNRHPSAHEAAAIVASLTRLVGSGSQDQLAAKVRALATSDPIEIEGSTLRELDLLPATTT